MEPRARAGKNVGKETFPAKDLASLMYAYGDVSAPLPETIRTMDHILTEFLEGVCFEASKHATVAGRQKLKLDDFEFSLRRQPEYLGKVKTMFDKRKEIIRMRKVFDADAEIVAKNDAAAAAAAAAAADGAGAGLGGSKKRSAAAVQAVEELLGDDDDDPDIIEALQNKKRKIG